MQDYQSNQPLSDSQMSVDISERLIEWIESRRSMGNLTIPAPNQVQINRAIACAMSAPDHKKLKPWRFVVIEGNARHDLGKAFLLAALEKAEREGMVLDDKTRQKTYQMPLRAPVIITVMTQMQIHEKVPAFEQLLSAGAVVQNLLLALQAQNFSTVWRTGLLTNEPAVKRFFGVESDDYICAFVYVGSSCPTPKREPILTDDFVEFRR